MSYQLLGAALFNFMPIIAAFFGMIIRIFHADHNPPHIHVQYAEDEAIFEIKTGRLLYGSLPRRLRPLLSQWMRLRRLEIMKAWNDAQAHRMPKRVKPIE